MLCHLIQKGDFFFGRRQNLQIPLEDCILSDMDMKDTTGELDESDIMTVEEFHRIFNFYKKEKTIHVDDAGMFNNMDIFGFFASRDINVDVVTEKNKTPDVDEILEDVVFALNEFRYSKAEIFYMECQLTNPKDICCEFTFVGNSNFDFSKTGSLLNQTSKNYFLREKKRKTMQCCALDLCLLTTSHSKTGCSGSLISRS